MLRRLCVILVILFVTSCGMFKDPIWEPPDDLEAVAGSWKCISAHLSGVPKSTYNKFVLSFSGTPGEEPYSYYCMGLPTPTQWSESGTWKYGTDITRDIILDSDFWITYWVEEVNGEDELKITFSDNVSTPMGLINTWVFTFRRE
jgi:hypothetical protein